MQHLTFHITVGGVPFCKSELTLEDWSTGTCCQHGTKEKAESGAELCRKNLPQHTIKVVEGQCPRPGEMSAEEYDDWAYGRNAGD